MEKGEGTEELEKFEDRDEISLYSQEALGTMVRNALLRGDGGKIQPKAFATRAETAVLLKRIYDLL